MFDEDSIERPYYCGVTLDNGALQIFKFSANSVQLVFFASKFWYGKKKAEDFSAKKKRMCRKNVPNFFNDT